MANSSAEEWDQNAGGGDRRVIGRANRLALPRLGRRFGLRTRITLGVLGLSVALWFMLGSIAQIMLRQSQLDRAENQAWRSEIGRASCRERVCLAV